MVTHFFNATTQDHLWTSEIPDVVPEKGDVVAAPNGKTYIVVQRTFTCLVVATAAPADGIINIAATPAKSLNVELQILMMEITPATEGIPQ